jgi:hypothetical protein
VLEAHLLTKTAAQAIDRPPRRYQHAITSLSVDRTDGARLEPVRCCRVYARARGDPLSQVGNRVERSGAANAGAARQVR